MNEHTCESGKRSSKFGLALFIGVAVLVLLACGAEIVGRLEARRAQISGGLPLGCKVGGPPPNQSLPADAAIAATVGGTMRFGGSFSAKVLPTQPPRGLRPGRWANQKTMKGVQK